MINKKDIKIEQIKLTGPGGQKRNKTQSGIRITHFPTGITVTIDGRTQSQNKKVALKELEKRLDNLKQEKIREKKKERRDKRIHDTTVVRTYDFKRNIVTNHLTGKTAPLDKVLKGNLALIQDKKSRITLEEFLKEGE